MILLFIIEYTDHPVLGFPGPGKLGFVTPFMTMSNTVAAFIVAKFETRTRLSSAVPDTF